MSDAPNEVDEFSPEYKPVVAVRDILQLQAEAMRGGVPEAELAYLRHKSANTTDIDSAQALKRRIAEYIHMRTLHGKGTTRVDVNRRFSKVAKRYETTTNDLIGELFASGRLTELERGGKSVVATASIYNEVVLIVPDVSQYIANLVANA